MEKSKSWQNLGTKWGILINLPIPLTFMILAFLGDPHKREPLDDVLNRFHNIVFIYDNKHFLVGYALLTLVYALLASALYFYSQQNKNEFFNFLTVFIVSVGASAPLIQFAIKMGGFLIGVLIYRF